MDTDQEKFSSVRVHPCSSVANSDFYRGSLWLIRLDRRDVGPWERVGAEGEGLDERFQRRRRAAAGFVEHERVGEAAQAVVGRQDRLVLAVADGLRRRGGDLVEDLALPRRDELD